MRLGELLGALSLATDLATGMPLETSLRTCVLATQIARLVGIAADGELGEVRSTALLRHLGCTAYAHEAARLGGDDQAMMATYAGVDPSNKAAVIGRTVSKLARDAPLGRRLAAVARVMTHPGAGAALVSAHCTQAVALAEDLQLPDGVATALGQIYERHDGRGGPHRLTGDALRPAAQVLHLAELIEVQHRTQGRDAAVAEVRRRRGKHVAPALADALLAAPDALWPVLEAPSVWDHYLEDEASGPAIDGRGSPAAGSGAEGRRGVIDGRGSPAAGSGAEGRRGVIDGRGSPAAGSGAEGRRGEIDGRGSPAAGSGAEGRRGAIDGRGSPAAGSGAEGRRGVIDGRGSAAAGSGAIDLERIAMAFGRFADLKSPFMLGHSTAVAALVTAACEDAAALPRLRLAALLHDLGTVSVPNGIWDKPGPLNAMEWERVRLHGYYTQRILAQTPLLADVAAIAGGHHDRLDGTGYHRGANAAMLDREVRLLAAADVYQALREARPHRPARSQADAIEVLAGEARDGRLCPRAVDAVLGAAGLPRPERKPPAGLTPREVEVLIQLARGSTNKEIASELGIAVRTANHHVENIYAKLDVTTRAAAAVFAVRHDLVVAD